MAETDDASGAGDDPTADDTVADSDEPAVDPDEEDDDDCTKPLSDRLVCDLTVHRTMALRNALAGDPQLATLACLHTMVLQLFYHYGQDSCVEITPKATHFGAQAEGLKAARGAVTRRRRPSQMTLHDQQTRSATALVLDELQLFGHADNARHMGGASCGPWIRL